jgi:hypothetical protein
VNNILGQLGGKKFLLALFGLAAVVLNAKFGVSEQSVLAVGGIVAAYVLGQGLADGLSGGATSSVAQLNAGTSTPATTTDTPK